MAPSTIDRLRALIGRVPREARPWAAAVAVVGALAVVAGVALLVGAGSHGGGPPATADDDLFDLPMATAVPRAADTTVPRLVVHAAGAVSQPGVYALAVGARVDDLIAAAGGVAPDADVDRLNLAAPLQDGARVYVPRRGELDVPAVNGPDGVAATGSAGDETSAPGGSGGPSTGPIDLNRASATELETLPGIGPSLAQAIVDHRARNGPFSSVDDLVDVRGIGPTRLEQLRPLVKV
jgi:competence protein ComEA